MKDYNGRYAQLNSAFPCSQVGFSTPPVVQSYHYSPMYSYTNPCSKTNYYSSCGNCPRKLSATDAYSNQPLTKFGGCGNYYNDLYADVEQFTGSIQGKIRGKENVRLRRNCNC